MGADEEGTLERLKAIRASTIDPSIATYRGRVVKSTGDGILVEFASAVNASRFALELQYRMGEQNASIPQDLRIEFRIGIHVGDIIFDDNDIFGDGVNIAARLEGIAVPGGICISDDTHRQIRDRVEAAFEDKGEFDLKNIARPVRVFTMAGPRILSARATEAASAPALPDRPSIAVLPFQNLSGDPEQEYFAEGIVEDLITALSRFKSLFVIARNSSFTYKGKAVDIKQVGRELGVRYLLEGSVRKGGSKLRISGRLIDAASGGHLWADTIDGALDELFEFQDKITLSVVSAVAPQIERAGLDRAYVNPPDNLQAYDYYLRALWCLYQFGHEEHEQAKLFLENAIRIAPQYAIAHAALAFWHTQRRAFGWNTDVARDAEEAASSVRHALQLDRNDALVLTNSGSALLICLHEAEASAELFEQATKINPNLAVAWSWAGLANIFIGDHERAAEQLQAAIRLSPRDPRLHATYNGLAMTFLFTGKPAEGLQWAERAARLSPTFLGAYRTQMACHVHCGNFIQAASCYAHYKTVAPNERVSDLRKRAPYRRAVDIELLEQGFRLAGMPE